MKGDTKMTIRFLQIREASGEAITSPKAVCEIMTEESKADRECMWVLHLNTKNMLIEKELVSVGTLNASLVSPREIFKRAIINSAYGIILVHNHPSGFPEPSSEDEEILSLIEKAGEILCIPLIDFIIISPAGKYWSGKENGMLKNVVFQA